MERSEQIGELAAALAKAQGAIKGAGKSKENPFFKSSYADLAAVMEACREPLSKNGIAYIQSTQFDAEHKWIETILVHSSGQWVSSRYLIKPVKDDPQGVGSAVTYARRYAIMALVGIVAEDEDDDGNAASARQNGSVEHAKRPAAGKPDDAAKKWAHDAEAAIRACRSLDELRTWETKNAGAMRKLGQIDAGLLKGVEDAMADKYEKYNPMAAE